MNKITAVSQATLHFMQKYAESTTQPDLIGDLCLFGKYGDYTFGIDKEKLEHGTKCRAHTLSTVVGYRRWRDGRPFVGPHGLPADGFELPPRDTLGDTDRSLWELDSDGEPKDPWEIFNTIVLSRLSDNKLLTFSTSSQGGRDAIGKLLKEWVDHAKVKSDETPIIALEMDSYQHRNPKVGEVRKPVFKLAGWCKLDTLPEVDSDGEQAALPAPEPEIISPTRPNGRKPKAKF